MELLESYFTGASCLPLLGEYLILGRNCQEDGKVG